MERFLYRVYVVNELTEKVGSSEKTLQYMIQRYNQVWSQSHYVIETFMISKELATVKIQKIEALAFAMLNAFNKHPIILEVCHLFFFTMIILINLLLFTQCLLFSLEEWWIRM
jgi:hypothetical protein